MGGKILERRGQAGLVRRGCEGGMRSPCPQAVGSQAES